MRRIILVLSLMVTLFIGLSAEESASKGDILVKITNIKISQKGNLFLAIYKGEENFKGKNNSQAEIIIPVKDKECNHLFKNIPYGNYAIALFHDKNGNEKIDTGLFGIPKEGYGFSNKSRKYKKASFDLKSEKYEVIIKIKY